MLAGSLALWRRRRGVFQVTGAIVLNRVDVIAIHYCHQVGVSTASRPTRLFRAHIKLAAVLKRAGERVCFRRNHAASFVCVSDGVAEEMREHFPQLADRVLTIHNGVDTATFERGSRADEARAMRDALGIAEDQLVAAFVGSEWERKGLGPLIKALAAARGWDLLVAGGRRRAALQANGRRRGRWGGRALAGRYARCRAGL
jgi:hypothetical protein